MVSVAPVFARLMSNNHNKIPVTFNNLDCCLEYILFGYVYMLNKCLDPNYLIPYNLVDSL